MAEKLSEKAMGYGWRLFGIAFLLMLMYAIVWGYTFVQYYVGLIHPEVKDVLPQLPDSVYRVAFVLFWVGVFLVPVAIIIVLLSAIFELHTNYAIYRATMTELKKTSS